MKLERSKGFSRMVHRSSSRYIMALIMALILTLAVAACSSQQTTANKNQQKDGGARGRGGRPINVQTALVQRISVQRSVDLSGNLVSPDQAKISSEVAGVVRDVLIEIGQEVALGQEMVRLDSTELKLALDRAESALRQVEAQLGINEAGGGQIPPEDQIPAIRAAAATRDSDRAQLKRLQEANTKGLATRVELETAQTKVKVSEAGFQSAGENVQVLKATLQDRRASFDLARKKVSDAVIKAPVAGAIAERTVQRGEYISERTPIGTIVRMNPLKLKTAVQEKFANLIHQNQTVDFSVEPYPGEKFHGKIAYISPAVDQSTRTFAVEVLVDNPARKLKPGFFAQGQILVGVDQNVLAVPEETVSTLAGVSSVYVIDHGKIKQTSIQLGEHEGKSFEVLSGLNGDEILAAGKLNELVTGLNVSGGGDDEGETAGPPPKGGEAGSGGKAGKGEKRGGDGKDSAQ